MITTIFMEEGICVLADSFTHLVHYHNDREHGSMQASITAL